MKNKIIKLNCARATKRKVIVKTYMTTQQM